MKKIVFILLIALFSISTFAQSFTKTERDVSEFNSIKLKCSADLIITQGEKNSVIVETEAKNQEKVKILFRNNSLIIDIDAKIFKSKRLNVYITTKDLSSIINQGSGDIEIKSSFKSVNFVYNSEGSGDLNIEQIITNKFISIQDGSGDVVIKGDIKSAEISVQGSGDFDAKNLNLTSCNIVMNGSGDINLQGVSENIKVSQTGSGDLQCNNFSVLNAIIVKTGSGDASINVKNDITLTNTGSGDFHLKGNPTKRKISVTGSGDFYDK